MIAVIAAALAIAAAPVNSKNMADAAHRAMVETGANGLAIAVINRGQVVSVEAFGKRNAAGDPLTTDTVMYGASITKAVFGYLVMQLVDERKLDLDRPIAAMLPRRIPDYGNLDAYGQWGDLAADDRWKLITPRIALTHSTGFANFGFMEPDQKLRIHFDPGTRFSYSGEGLMLLQFGLGREALLARYEPMFRKYHPQAMILSRIESGSFVIDKERTTAGGRSSEGVAIYEIDDGKIRRVWFTP